MQQFLSTVRPVLPITSLTPTGAEQTGDFAIWLGTGTYNLGTLLIFSSGAWVNATPTSNLSGYIQAAQIQANSITANQLAADCITAAAVSSGVITSLLIDGDIIQTAASGARIALSSSSGLQCVNTSGDVTCQIWTDVAGVGGIAVNRIVSANLSNIDVYVDSGDDFGVFVGASNIVTIDADGLTITANAAYGFTCNKDAWVQGHLNVVTDISINSTKVIGAQGATISDPSGGGTVDTQARSAINTIIDRLQAHGLIA
ncbi:MAG TPA: hypothetical protein DGH68_04020 [Bacteroidetes bacterium]|nr:hypothetical protein [Bacteroidota bacterium]